MPLEIVWSARALARLQEIRDYVAKDKPDAAEKLGARIIAVVEVLKRFPNLGRAGAESGIRELPIGGTPYIVLYTLRGKRVNISTIWHGAQSRNPRRTKKR